MIISQLLGLVFHYLVGELIFTVAVNDVFIRDVFVHIGYTMEIIVPIIYIHGWFILFLSLFTKLKKEIKMFNNNNTDDHTSLMGGGAQVTQRRSMPAIEGPDNFDRDSDNDQAFTGSGI